MSPDRVDAYSNSADWEWTRNGWHKKTKPERQTTTPRAIPETRTTPDGIQIRTPHGWVNISDLPTSIPR